MFQIPYGNSLLSVSLTSKRIIHLLSLLIVIIFLSYFFFLLFPCHLIFAHNILTRIFALSMVFSPIFFLDMPFQVFNLAGFFCLNFSLVFDLAGFFLLNVISSKPIHVNWAKHLFSVQICNSCSTS